MTKAYMEIFVSTGAKNAMFTLRTSRVHSGPGFFFTREAYIKNLSTDLEKAEELAMEYTKNLAERIATPDFEVYYIGPETDELFKRRGKLSVADTQAVESIEAGIVPFGKHKDKKIADLPDTYLCWLTDQLKNPPDQLKPGFFTLCTVASGIANERGLLAARQAKRDERHEQDLKSTHFGEIGKRYTEEVEVLYKNEDKFDDGSFCQWKYTIKIGDDILTHNGKVDLEVGKAKLTFTVKFHCDTKTGVKRTYINRIKLAKEA
ncbi:hypothetical protein Ab1vBOLIVR5_gp12 [Agrobacterium phage OLIVR5]|uniref:Uncharacterized protein n=1 Tax=Agrobacterium phage OLIVR5 TaxID=2723773 RepID=A0A858MUT2_9CAUD|nr:hypothetical protein KNU99_gp012 [Agrobacterium phage OLIVR5]QIW87660.1 hypothetical protein Ab1vBOLIVR5_gp12 [Agrobacterium phage OLIVR5]QIW87919.1 hypothetical protein Ab1vBOLIVR6_gp12 [Agrobacterium phage OLIVR6]